MQPPSTEQINFRPYHIGYFSLNHPRYQCLLVKNCNCSYTTAFLLKTVQLLIHNHHWRSYFVDKGAQWSLITQQFANNLQLQPSGVETISVSSFGAQVSRRRSLEMVTIFVHTLNSTRIQILVLKACCSNMKLIIHTFAQHLLPTGLAHPITED